MAEIQEVAKDELHIAMQQLLKKVPGNPSAGRSITIFRVPDWFHDGHKILYEPKMISIGPYHRGKKHLRAMEEHKWSFLRDFLFRNEEVSLQVYLQEIRVLETQARLCYSETFDMPRDDFVRMLILDGCFLVEYFLKLQCEHLDAFLWTGWGLAGLATDILLLENQVPLFIIHKLYSICHGSNHGNCEDYDCPLLKFIFPHLPHKDMLMLPQSSCRNIHHLLHLYHKCLVSHTHIGDSVSIQLSFGAEYLSGLMAWLTTCKSLFLTRSNEDEKVTGPEAANGHLPEWLTMIPCASELRRTGIIFKKKKRPRDMFDISFKNGIMEMPFMAIDACKKIILSNVVAFELSQAREVFPTITSYMSLMDVLVNTERDVALLQKQGILKNLLQNHEEAADFFNHFADIGMNYRFLFFDLFKNIKEYSDSPWNRYRARLMRDYFNSPWTILSILAGGLLLILTVVQTYYAVYSSVHN